MLVGFADEETPRKCRDLIRRMEKTVELPAMLAELDDVNRQVYLVKPNADIPAATLTDGGLTPGVGACTVYELEAISQSGEALSAQVRGGVVSPLVVDVYNLQFCVVPSGEKWYVAIQDSFGKMIFCSGGGDPTTAEGVLASRLVPGGTATMRIARSSETDGAVSWVVTEPEVGVVSAYYQTVSIEAGTKIVVRMDDTIGGWVYLFAEVSQMVFACPASGSAATGFEAVIREDLT